MFKKGIVILILICICSPVFTLDMKNAAPYEDGEFPKWALDIRRGEIIFFGSIPLAYAMTSLVANSAFNANLDFWQTVGISAGISAAIVVIDYVIGLFSD